MKRHERYYRGQKLIGLLVIILSILFTAVLTLLGEAAGIILLGVPLGIYLIFTKKKVLDIDDKIKK